MIAVIGYLLVDPDHRAAAVGLSLDSVRLARAAPGCLHFSVTPDPVEPTRVSIAELWSSREDLDAFRASGSADDEGDDPFQFVREFHVHEYDVVAA